MHNAQGSQMPEPKLERIFVEKQTIWRVSYLGMVRDFKTDWEATGFFHDLWLSHKQHNDLIQR
jgi:hypothetical protein